MLPIPSLPKDEEENENWEFSPPSGEILLKPHAMTNLRREVRREQKERRDAVSHWITLVIGLVGMMMGFVSLLMK